MVVLDFGSGDEDYGEDDDGGACEHVGVHLFSVEGAAEDEGHDGIDVGVSRHLCDWDILEQPDVGGESDERSGKDEVDDGPERRGCPGCAVKVSGGECQGGTDEPGDEHLPSAGGKRVDGHVPTAGANGSDGPTDAGAENKDRSEELASAEGGVSGEIGPEKESYARDSKGDSGESASGEMVGAVADPLKDEEPERGDGDEEGGEAGGDVDFRPSHDDVGGDEEEESDDAEAEEIAQGDGDTVSAEGAEGEHEKTGGGETEGSHDERREVLDGEADGEVGGSPEDVDQCECDDDLQPPWCRDGSHGIP